MSASPFRIPPRSLQPTQEELEKQLKVFNVKEDIVIDFTKWSQKRDKIAYEILTSESTYLRDLEIETQLFRNPLVVALKRGELGITQKIIDVIFGTVSQLLSVNRKLFDDLKERLRTWSDTQKIGDVISSLTPFLKMYRQYTDSYEDSIASLKEAEKRDSNFALYIEELALHPVARGRTLSSFLILPVQRIPRYVLLLQDLIKNTEETHVDFPNLVKALGDMREVSVVIDLAVEQAENRKKCLAIRDMFPNSPFPIIEAHRRFVFEGWLMKQNRRGERKKKKFFLFNDILIYGYEDVKLSPMRGGCGNLKFGAKVEIKAMSVTDIPDVELHPEHGDSGVQLYRPPHGIFIEAPRKSFNVFADTQEEKDTWLEFFMKLKGEEDKTLNRVEDVGTAAFWVPDFAMKACPLCYSEFNFFLRRHHCRKCGTLTCDKCSKQKMVVPAVGMSPMRVCDSCSRDKS